MRYAAFLSYSHADARWAKWLLRRLESYRVPSRLVGTQGAHGPIGSRLGRIFRDRDELPTAGDLGDTIRGALAESDALVVICSPAAAQSRWVNAEAEAFRALGRGDRIACFIVDGDPSSQDPATACFPAAATAPGPDGVPREPLAADARKSGDGRERAFLKLVAGLLGVSYDALAQREAQRRHRRMFAITAASVIGMAIAIGLAATAYVARNDAQRRQAQAEDILGFMLGDLREKLTTVGRLDLMRAVDDKATAYFATLDPRDLSDRALEEQARSLTGIGQVRLGEGDHDAAMHAFREALARSTALHDRAPGNGQRLYDLAQAEFWIGFVAFEQGDYDTAEVWQRRYHASAVRLAAMDRDNFDWQLEVAYGLHNLAVMDERRGRFADAERSVREEIDLYRHWMRERPDDLTLRANAADAMSWLGTLMLRQGELATAEPYFSEQVEALQRNVADDPANATWKDYSVRALLLLADAQAQRGRLDEARASIATATPLAASLAAQDPANNGWRTWLAACRWWQAQLIAGSDPDRALVEATAAESLLRQAHETEPRIQRVLVWLVRSHQQLARLALARDDLAGARVQAAAAQALIEPAWAAEQNTELRLVLAETRVLVGLAADRAGRRDRAVAAWESARELLLPTPGSDPAFDRLDPLVRALHHLGLHDEARPYMKRLDAAGYVPLDPWPRSARTLAFRRTP
jgi:eukaryotic-like serine/threonine-protein kinase